MEAPREALAGALGREVEVTLKGGQEYRGRLAGLDAYLGLRLEAAAELLPGGPREVGDLVVRGNNVLLVGLPAPGGRGGP